MYFFFKKLFVHSGTRVIRLWFVRVNSGIRTDWCELVELSYCFSSFSTCLQGVCLPGLPVIALLVLNRWCQRFFLWMPDRGRACRLMLCMFQPVSELPVSAALDSLCLLCSARACRYRWRYPKGCLCLFYSRLPVTGRICAAHMSAVCLRTVVLRSLCFFLRIARQLGLCLCSDMVSHWLFQ